MPSLKQRQVRGDGPLIDRFEQGRNVRGRFQWSPVDWRHIQIGKQPEELQVMVETEFSFAGKQREIGEFEPISSQAFVSCGAGLQDLRSTHPLSEAGSPDTTGAAGPTR